MNMSSLAVLHEIKQLADRGISQESSADPLRQPFDPSFRLAMFTRGSRCISVWVRDQDNLEKRVAVRIDRTPIDLSDGEWDRLELQQVEEAR